jgi:transcriptional regulator with XRE-family HTH domain
MESVLEGICERIRLLRNQKNMTLKEVSKKTGFSVSFLSQVENGTSSLAITSLQKIAGALSVPISYFFEEPTNKNFTTLGAERKFFRIEQSNMVYARLAGDFVDRALEPIYVTLAPRTVQDTYNHQGEEFCYILQGEIVVNINDEEYRLKVGDSIHFPSTLNHAMRNPNDEPAHMISVLTPIIF